jgi:NAD(P)-dependent dehydrogenase (short-subunit alcohol dehydrogenase family)
MLIIPEIIKLNRIIYNVCIISIYLYKRFNVKIRIYCSRQILFLIKQLTKMESTLFNTMLQADSLKNKVIVVTGGGTGLGKSMSQIFLQLGAKIVITSRKMDVLEQTAKELELLTNGEVLPVACDVRDYRQVDELLQKSIERFGRVDGLLNNAAGNFVSPTERLSPKAFDVVVDIVLKGTYNCVLTFGKYWIDNNIPATVLSIVTTYASTGSGYVVPSACAKAGVVALTKSLAVEWAKYNIRFNAIAPGPFPTEGAWSRLLPGNVASTFDPEKRIPLKRFGKHEELANLASYLLSNYSAYMNGEIVTIDGGEWLKGAGEFNGLDVVSQEEWNEIEKSIRGK